MTEDRAPDGTVSRLCWNADCRHRSVLTPALVGTGSVEWRTEAELELELERTILESEVRLQSLSPEDIYGDAATLRERWQQAGHLEEYEEILDSLAQPGQPEPEDLLARRASVELLRALSVARAGPLHSAWSPT